jgi:hypothetical protein
MDCRGESWSRKFVEFVEHGCLGVWLAAWQREWMRTAGDARSRDRDEEAHFMPIQAGAANLSTTVDPAKLLEIVRRWCPAAPQRCPSPS